METFVYLLFSKNDELSPELESVVSITEMCSIMTFITASVLGSVTAKDKFVKENKHTKFTTKFRALVCIKQFPL